MAIGVLWFPQLPTAITELPPDAGKSQFLGHNKGVIPEINFQEPHAAVNVSTWALRTSPITFFHSRRATFVDSRQLSMGRP